ncbi:ATP-binding protein [uncultured Draconibacterium sp.]|uniref:sensor histidine kinase n=1 Tax=uncultured Draconibacterium sp. TaxID=1573823 RepID=UPI003216A3AF
MATSTQYAPAERQMKTTVFNQNKLFTENELFSEIANSVSQMLVVLNKQRQIVYANNYILEAFGFKDLDNYAGRRPGELLDCVHASQSSGGCGTTQFCKTCGAVNAILEAQTGVQSTKECRIETRSNDAIDIQVRATPFNANGEEFTIFVVTDISNEKRRQVLERVFFHDVLNSAGGISGLSNIIGEISDPEELASIASMIHKSADDLISEIQLQRELSAAERGEIELNYANVSSFSILSGVADLYSRHEVTKGKRIVIGEKSEDFILSTDAVLLKRILGNMTKNALEASTPNGTVTLMSVKLKDKNKFSVHNENYIDSLTQLQLFKRSFSTKGKGRGIGTYSMKLFGEKYLKGKVGFESTPENGTTFYIELKE